MDIFGVEDGSGIGFYENGGSGADRRALRPAVDLIALDGQEPVGLRLGLIVDNFRVSGQKCSAQEVESQTDCHQKGKDPAFPENF